MFPESLSEQCAFLTLSMFNVSWKSATMRAFTPWHSADAANWDYFPPSESWLLNIYQPSSITACSEEASIPVAIVTVTDGQATETK